MAAERARLLDGAAVARAILQELAPRVAQASRAIGRAPSLGVVLVGEDPSSEIYVRGKLKAAGEAGITAELIRLPAVATLPDVLAAVRRLNESPAHDGILVQSPLPAGLGREAERAVNDIINPAKDVDGFSPVNVGLLVQNRAVLAPCTPSGVMELLKRSQIPVAGARAVVIGRSDIVGKPMALLLLRADATVTVCHSKTTDLARVASTADILVVAIGRPAFVTRDFVKPGATVIDVGVNRVTDKATAYALFGPDSPRRAGFDTRGSVVVGDVHPAVADVAGALTPVPGGVGPLTIAMLLANTVTATLAKS